MRAVIYVDTACELAKAFEIGDFPVKPIDVPFDRLEDHDIRPQLYELEPYVGKLRARNIFEIEGNLLQEYVVLDDDWKSKATTYVQHIRQAVKKAEVEEPLREAIFQKLNELQSEIDRNRTRLASVTEGWLATTEAMGMGAKNLEPVVKLFERLGCAFSWLRKARADDAPAALPPPDKLGLPDLRENGE